MALQNINRGTTPNDGQGDSARAGALKINENFAYLLNAEAKFKAILGPEITSEAIETDVVEAINTGSPFTLAFANLAFIKYFEFVDGDIKDIYFFKLVNIGGGNKTFGTNGSVTLTENNLFLTGQKLKSVQDFQELNTTVTEDFGDIGTTSLIDYVNGISPAITIQATSVGATILKAIVDDEGESYLFKGEAGDYGQGELQLVDVDLEALSESTQVNVFSGTRKNKTITASTYTLLLEDVNEFLRFENACTVTVPLELPANLEFQGIQAGMGQVTFTTAPSPLGRNDLNVFAGFLKETAGQHCFWGIRTEGSNRASLTGTLKLA